MEIENKNIGSLRCICCDKELKDYENVICMECDSKSDIEKDIYETIKNIMGEH